MKDVQHRKEDAMTLPTADLISEVLRLDEALAAWVNLPAVDRNPMEGLRLMGDIAKHAPELARRLRDAEEKLARANEALKASEALVARLDFVHEDPAYQAVWFCNQIHSGPYRGPQYDKELAAAKEAISAARSRTKKPQS